jgi:hypothetical protein
MMFESYQQMVCHLVDLQRQCFYLTIANFYFEFGSTLPNSRLF